MWGMKFNEDKCKVVHFGRNNKKYDYTMNGIKLDKSEAEPDLGVKIHSSLKPSKHCQEVAKKASGILGNMSRAFHYRDRNIFLKLY